MRRVLLVVAGVVAVLVAHGTVGAAQAASAAIDVTTLTPEAANVYRTWQRYLVSKGGKWSENAGLPSADWVDSEQRRRWPLYDLAGFYLADGATPTIVGIDQVTSCGDTAYRITTRFELGDQRLGASSWFTTVTETVYAVTDGGRWVLGNALLRNTCGWRRVTVGAMTYVFAPDYPYNAARAHRAAAFVDSLASAFQVPKLDSLTYYLAPNVDEMYRIIGVESAVRSAPNAVGGLAQPINHQLFSGSPVIGEEYRHELAHLVLAPLCCARTSYLVSEGVPTWIGGTAGMDFSTAARGLAAFLAEHPLVSLDSMLSGQFPNAQFYPAGAVLTAMVFDRGGVAAVRGLFDAGRTPAELRPALAQLFGQSWSSIVVEWRRRVMAFAPSPPDGADADNGVRGREHL